MRNRESLLQDKHNAVRKALDATVIQFNCAIDLYYKCQMMKLCDGYGKQVMAAKLQLEAVSNEFARIVQEMSTFDKSHNNLLSSMH